MTRIVRKRPDLFCGIEPSSRDNKKKALDLRVESDRRQERSAASAQSALIRIAPPFLMPARLA